MARPGRCPRCGTATTPFAAGCAVCGEDLEAARRPRRTRSFPAIRAPALPGRQRELAEDAVAMLLMLVVAVYSPLFGIGLALLIAWDSNRNGRRLRRNLALVALAVAVLAIFAPGLSLR